MITEYFDALSTTPDVEIDLAEGALAIASTEYPGVDMTPYLERLDFYASQCRESIEPGGSTELKIRGLNRYLFEELGFSGDLKTFNDPRNSFLNEVMDRKLGIPISLSVLYMEVGRRLGLGIMGVSFPGHFLVKVSAEEGELVLDPFAGGRQLGEGELQGRLAQFSQDIRRNWRMENLLKAASKREILARMLRNLKAVYLESGDYVRVLNCVETILRLYPDLPHEIRDRALVLDQLEEVQAAIEDYQRFLVLEPASRDVPYVRARLEDLQRSVQRLH